MDTEHKVRDGNRHLTFNGHRLAFSSSRTHRSKGRWIEFELFRTGNGAYVLSRVGQTRFVHAVDCHVSRDNELAHLSLDEVGSLEGLFRCPDCFIDLADDAEFCAEIPRYWAMRLLSAEDVVDALHKRDRNGNLYLTLVSRRLLEDAAEVDDEIARVYYHDTLD